MTNPKPSQGINGQLFNRFFVRYLLNSSIQLNSTFDFLSIGLACHALCLIDEAGLLLRMQKNEPITYAQIDRKKNPHLIKSAFVTLLGANLLYLEDEQFTLTELGFQISENIGAITMPLIGYRSLFNKQYDLLNNPDDWKDTDIDYTAIAASSVRFSVSNLEPIVLDVFRELDLRGTVCDLGCGTGKKLFKICSLLKVHGLGIEKNQRVIEESQHFLRNANIEIIQADILNLRGIWEDVDVAMMDLVFHDIIPHNSAVLFLQSLFTHFPRLRTIVIIDIVTYSLRVPSILPGFDYVHGLQGMTPRNYEETIQTFSDADLNIVKETQIPNVPNTFIWVLTPQKK